jgi:Na+-driven multidrug efflux pump
VRRVTRMGLWLGIGFGVLSLPVFWFSGPILLALGQEPQVAANGQLYLRIAGLASCRRFWPSFCARISRRWSARAWCSGPGSGARR